MSLRRLGSIVIKELRQLRRDRLTFAMIIGIPTMQLILFGYAINLDVRNLETAVLDQANTARSRELVAGMAATGVIHIGRAVSSTQEIDALLRAGEISAALVLPRDFEARMERRDRPAVQIIVDGSEQVIQAAARQLAAYPLYQDRGWTTNGGGVEVVNFYNPERRAAVNTVPGLVGMILTMTMVLFTSIALVRERERGNLEMLIATPVSPWELTVGKILPFVGIGLVQTTVVLVLGDVLFDVPLRGSLLELYRRRARVHHGEPVARHLHLDADAHAVPGHADVVLHVPAADPVVGLHVPVRRHARRGAVRRGGHAADAFPAARARHHAARRGSHGALAVARGARRVHRGDARRRRIARAQAARLAGRLVRVELELHAVAGGVVEEELREIQAAAPARCDTECRATSSAARTRRARCS